MRTILVSLATSLALVGNAHAVTVFSDTFDSDNGGLSAAAYTGFAKWDVMENVSFNFPPPPPGSQPSVDLIRSGDFGVTCDGGGGSCVDLGGSTLNGGMLQTRQSFQVNAGDIVTLTMRLSGSQIGLNNDPYFYGPRAGSPAPFFDIFLTTPLASSGPFNFPTPVNGFAFVGFTGLSPAEPWGTHIVRYRTGATGNFRLLIGSGSVNDNDGTLLDNVSIDVSAGAVPEPASWALMLLGFGAIGTAMRSSNRQAKTPSCT